MIAKVGDKIKWSFGNKNVPKFLKGKEFIADVAMVDENERHYGVYADYGQDLIDFDKCEIFPLKINENE